MNVEITSTLEQFSTHLTITAWDLGGDISGDLGGVLEGSWRGLGRGLGGVLEGSWRVLVGVFVRLRVFKLGKNFFLCFQG